MLTKRGRPSVKAHAAEFVVDLADLDGVLEILRAIPVPWEAIGKSELLQLALVRLTHISNFQAEHTDPPQIPWNG